ncbi:cytochrome c [Antarctobacter sp.]|uniref:c-type cytochrome n=1 Tax=Antarctobacter sp. TaxID=1872577 RepID=UPI002B27B65D|nr:cytochrome c [Antarctobacter sp.]
MYIKALAVAALITATACTPFLARQDGTSRGWFAPSRSSIDEADTHPGAEVFAANCAYCHGDTGQGDGPLGVDLPVSPPDLTGLAVANGGSFPAERVMETIHGYPGKFHRGSMPEFGQALKGPVVEWRAPSGEIIMTPKGLLDVVAFVNSLQVDGES